MSAEVGSRLRTEAEPSSMSARRPEEPASCAYVQIVAERDADIDRD